MIKSKQIIKKADSYQQELKLLEKLEVSIQEKDFTALAKLFKFEVESAHYYYPINQNYREIEKNPIDIYTLFGNSSMGRKSSIYWANRYHEYPIIKIDVNLYSTELQFIERVASRLGDIIGVSELCKQIVVNEQINFDALTRYIVESQQRILIVVDNAERLTEPKRQIILYTMLEWMKKQVKQYVGLYILCKNIKFLESLEKRVKSRFTSKYLFYNHVDCENILRLLEQRLMGCKNISLQQFAIKYIRSKDFYTLVEHKFELGAKLTEFLLMLKGIFYSLDFNQFMQLEDDKQKMKYLDSIGRSMLSMVRPQVINDTFRNLLYPQLILMALIKNMIKKHSSTITFNALIIYYAEVKQVVLASTAGTSFNYSTQILQKAFKKLIQCKIIQIDDSNDNQYSAPITLVIYLEEMENLYLEMKSELPQFIIRILNYGR